MWFPSFPETSTPVFHLSLLLSLLFLRMVGHKETFRRHQPTFGFRSDIRKVRSLCSAACEVASLIQVEAMMKVTNDMSQNPGAKGHFQ